MKKSKLHTLLSSRISCKVDREPIDYKSLKKIIMGFRIHHNEVSAVITELERLDVIEWVHFNKIVVKN